MQERSHAFAMKSQIWLLDPRPDLPSIVAAVKHGFALSEASRTPVMLQLRIRACHVHGEFVASDNRAPSFTLKDALENPRRDTGRIGIVVQGGTCKTLLRVLERLGVADVYGSTRVPLYVMNVAYPVIDGELLRFCEGKRAILMVEEGQPNFIEQNVAAILRKAGS